MFKKLAFLFILGVLVIFNSNICNAEKVFAYQETKNGEYTGVDFFISTETIKTIYADYNYKNIDKHQPCIRVRTESRVASTGKLKYGMVYYYFFKDRYGNWCYFTSRLNTPTVTCDTGIKFSGGAAKKFLNVLKKYIDVDSLENTKADVYIGLYVKLPNGFNFHDKIL